LRRVAASLLLSPAIFGTAFVASLLTAAVVMSSLKPKSSTMAGLAMSNSIQQSTR
jgi:hypothetical protein